MSYYSLFTDYKSEAQRDSIAKVTDLGRSHLGFQPRKSLLLGKKGPKVGQIPLSVASDPEESHY